MVQVFHVHPDNPQHRSIKHAVEVLENGGVIVYPTDSAYAVGCKIGEKNAIERIRRLRQLDKEHNFTLLCKDLSELATYALVNNTIYRLLRENTPGACTFILQATQEVPKKLLHPKKKTIGLRIPKSKILQMLLSEFHEPIMSSSLILPHDSLPILNPEDFIDYLKDHVDLILHGGACGFDETTIVDCTGEHPNIIRHGKGIVSGI